MNWTILLFLAAHSYFHDERRSSKSPSSCGSVLTHDCAILSNRNAIHFDTFSPRSLNCLTKMQSVPSVIIVDYKHTSCKKIQVVINLQYDAMNIGRFLSLHIPGLFFPTALMAANIVLHPGEANIGPCTAPVIKPLPTKPSENKIKMKSKYC